MLCTWDAFAVATAKSCGAPVWGLNIKEQGSLVAHFS